MEDNSTALSPSNKEEAVVYFAAQGLKASEISPLVNLEPDSINRLLRDEKIQFQIKLVRHKLYGKDVQKKFRDLLPHAQQALEDIITNPNQKAGLRFSAAQEIFDRALGKPKQTVQHEGNLLQEIYEKLDGKKQATVIDVSPSEENPNGAYTLEENPNIRDSIDSWIKKEFSHE